MTTYVLYARKDLVILLLSKFSINLSTVKLLLVLPELQIFIYMNLLWSCHNFNPNE